MRNLTAIVRPPNRSIAEQMYEMVSANIEARVWNELGLRVLKRTRGIVDESPCAVVGETIFYAVKYLP